MPLGKYLDIKEKIYIQCTLTAGVGREDLDDILPTSNLLSFTMPLTTQFSSVIRMYLILYNVSTICRKHVRSLRVLAADVPVATDAPSAVSPVVAVRKYLLSVGELY